MRFRFTFFTNGILLIILGMTMLIPGAVDYLHGHENASAFFMSALGCFFVGGALFLSNYGGFDTFNIREGFMLTTVCWLFLSVSGAMPLYLSSLHISFVNAFFESVSGVTTTGSTVLSGLDSMSHGILLWRSILQWIGGIGIVAFAMVLLPFLKVGGMQLFQTESSDRSDKIIPQSRELVWRLVSVYIGLTVLCGLSYYILGMSGFDAVNHAMTTLSTGGYSTHDSSFGYFKSTSLQLCSSFFMLMGGLPFVLFVKFVFIGRFDFFKDPQVNGFLFIVAVSTVVIVGWLSLYNDEMSIWQGFVLTIFNVISVLTTTGFATADYTTWGVFITILFFLLTYIGGCAGSTSGGLKVMRIMVLFEGIKRQFHQLIYPNGAFIARYNGKPLDNDLITTVFGFLSLYVLLNVVLTLALTWLGLDFETAISGAVTAVANVGPGIGKIIGPSGNFSTLPDSAKWLLSVGMLLGRLEILTALVLFTPNFWRH